MVHLPNGILHSREKEGAYILFILMAENHDCTLVMKCLKYQNLNDWAAHFQNPTAKCIPKRYFEKYLFKIKYSK